MKKCTTLFLLCLGGALLAGCQHGPDRAPPWVPDQRAGLALWFPGAGDGWAAISAAGDLIVDGAGAPLRGGDFERLDGRRLDDGRWRLATVDTAANQVVVLEVADHRARTLTTLPVPDYEVNGLCLYQDRDAHLSVFVLDERGGADQWLLRDGGEPLHVRRLALPAGAEYCRVDDRRDALYVSEEGVGLWRYRADPERDPERTLVDARHPHGGVAESAKGLALIPGGVALLDADAAELHLYRDGAPVGAPLAVPDLDEPERLASRWRDGRLTLVVLDDDGAAARRLTVPWDAATTDREEADLVTVLPSAQTEPVARFGDAADDPAIWIHPDNPAASLVLGTDKKNGLHVYDLSGRERQFLPAGKLNNVDVRGNLAVASNRDHDSLHLFDIDAASGRLTDLGELATGLEEIYGLCMHRDGEGRVHAIANGKSGAFEQYRLRRSERGVRGERVRRFQVPSQPEGCVADDATGRLFVGEENAAVWVLPADPDDPTPARPVIEVGDKVVADIEGLALHLGDDHRYLVISSQGNNSYVVVDAVPPFAYRGRFRIGANLDAAIDGASETDGLEVTALDLGGAYGEGLLVVQDGRNRLPQAPQNFKYVPWTAVREALGL